MILAEAIARHFPMTNVVKAFNTVFAEVSVSQSSQISGHAITMFYAGDDPLSKENVRALITRLGDSEQTLHSPCYTLP